MSFVVDFLVASFISWGLFTFVVVTTVGDQLPSDWHARSGCMKRLYEAVVALGRSHGFALHRNRELDQPVGLGDGGQVADVAVWW